MRKIRYDKRTNENLGMIAGASLTRAERKAQEAYQANVRAAIEADKSKSWEERAE